jgi:hypothetical protein
LVSAQYTLRLATLDDVPAIRELIACSARGLAAADYTRAQIEAALQGAFGVDTALIRDGTLFVAETRAGEVVACGGWGRRRTLFGSDARAERDDTLLDPKSGQDQGVLRRPGACPSRDRARVAHALRSGRAARWILILRDDGNASRHAALRTVRLCPAPAD